MKDKYIGIKPYTNGKGGNLGSIFTKTVLKGGQIVYKCPDHFYMPRPDEILNDLEKGYLKEYEDGE